MVGGREDSTEWLRNELELIDEQRREAGGADSSPSPGSARNTLRFITWNIHGGGGKRIPSIVDQIATLQPDVVGLTEVRAGNLDELRSALRNHGLENIATTCTTGNANGVLLASRLPFTIVDDHVTYDQERWLALELDRSKINVLCVHIPGGTDNKFAGDGVGISGKKRKELMWNEVIRYARQHRAEPTVLLGDFNTGLPEDAQGTPFVLSDYIRVLTFEKYVDAWRHLNPESREFTWFTKRKNRDTGESEDYNGFRLDYVFVSPNLSDKVLDASHVHGVRTRKISDHAMVVAELAVSDNLGDEARSTTRPMFDRSPEHTVRDKAAAQAVTDHPIVDVTPDVVSDSLVSALNATRNPVTNHEFIRRFTAALGVTDFRAVVKPDKSYVVGARRDGLPDLHIYYGYTTGFVSEDEIIRAAGSGAGRAPSSRKGTWYVKHPTNQVRPSSRH